MKMANTINLTRRKHDANHIYDGACNHNEHDYDDHGDALVML